MQLVHKRSFPIREEEPGIGIQKPFLVFQLLCKKNTKWKQLCQMMSNDVECTRCVLQVTDRRWCLGWWLHRPKMVNQFPISVPSMLFVTCASENIVASVVLGNCDIQKIANQTKSVFTQLTTYVVFVNFIHSTLSTCPRHPVQQPPAWALSLKRLLESPRSTALNAIAYRPNSTSRKTCRHNFFVVETWPRRCKKKKKTTTG